MKKELDKEQQSAKENKEKNDPSEKAEKVFAKISSAKKTAHRKQRMRIADLKKKQTAAAKPPPKPTTPSQPTGRRVSAAEIEALYKKGVSFFANDRYDEALNVFKQVLVLDPNHAGAQEYRQRTEARLRILKGSG